MNIIRGLKNILRSNRKYYSLDFQEEEFLLFLNEIDRQVYVCQKKDITNTAGKIIAPLCPHCRVAVWNAGQVCAQCGTDHNNMFTVGGYSSYRFVGRRDFILKDPSLIYKIRSVWNDLHFYLKNGMVIKLSSR